MASINWMSAQVKAPNGQTYWFIVEPNPFPSPNQKWWISIKNNSEIDRSPTWETHSYDAKSMKDAFVEALRIIDEKK